ncbi:GGDEF domain-containing protein [Alteromonas sp. CYL-A6]|uniref:GGDEF domain-containing protein n=1 Tax=Alteromonas nitratireducens TaxID=3390813 RepID=UPI0034B47D4F
MENLHFVSGFVDGFFILLLSSITASVFVVQHLAASDSRTSSLRYFLLYFFTSVLAWLAAWAVVRQVIPTSFAISVILYCITLAALAIAILNNCSIFRFNRTIWSVSALFVVLAFFADSIVSQVLIEGAVTVVLMPLAVFSIFKRWRATNNIGSLLLFLACLLGLLSGIYQLYWLFFQTSVAHVVHTTFFIQAVSFSLVGMGLVTQMLVDEKQNMTEMAFTDPLTRLFNRRGMSKKVENFFSGNAGPNTTLHLMAIDIDFFKSINDTYGHEAGDVVLEKFADLLVSLVRSSDVCCRLGGEEFVVCLADITTEDALQLAERIREQIALFNVHHDGNTLSFTASIGLADNTGTDSLASLINKADQALYTAKNSGRNKVVLA